MRFELVDRVVERSAERIVTLKHVSLAEEYLQDHFPGFPVLPGVLMVEAMVQAARALLDDRGGARLVLGQVRALKYGRFVRPGDTLRVEVVLGGTGTGAGQDSSFELRGQGSVLGAVAGLEEPGGLAVSGRFTLRPVRLGSCRPVC
ncbi:MAG TPA: hypothetical protein VD963_06330 [Phycisphaerales bacterium]|nr:hypothetical protein [Phycisphaerales bacterium]